MYDIAKQIPVCHAVEYTLRKGVSFSIQKKTHGFSYSKSNDVSNTTNFFASSSGASEILCRDLKKRAWQKWTNPGMGLLIILDLRVFCAWKNLTPKIFSQMVVKNGDLGHGRIRKTSKKNKSHKLLASTEFFSQGKRRTPCTPNGKIGKNFPPWNKHVQASWMVGRVYLEDHPT